MMTKRKNDENDRDGMECDGMGILSLVISLIISSLYGSVTPVMAVTMDKPGSMELKVLYEK